MSDNRHKVTQAAINRMRQLRQSGLSYRKVADEMNEGQPSTKHISWATAYYWCNDEQRQKQRAKNALRRHTPEENKQRVGRDMARRQQRWAENPSSKLAHEIRAALSDKRCVRQSVRGIPIDQAEQMLRSGELNQPLQKFE